MGYYSLDPDNVSKIFEHYLQKKDSINIDLKEISKIFEDHFQSNASKVYSQYSNNYPSKTLCLLDAYHRNREEFLRVLESIHTEAIEKLKTNIEKKEFVIAEIMKTLLNDETCNDIEVQSIAAICSLKRLHKKITEYTVTSIYYSDVFEGLLNAYSNVLFDAECLEGHSWRRQTRLTNMEIFPLAKQMIEYNFTYQFPVAESAVFLFRQAIEVHIKRAFGIHYLKRKNLNGTLGADIAISHIIKYMKKEINNKKIALCRDIKVIEAINKWVNSYIHTGIFNYPFWYVDWIQNYLNQFFYVQNSLKKLYTSSQFNLNASIFAEENYVANIQENIRRNFPDFELIPYPNPDTIAIKQSEIDAIQRTINDLENTSVII